MYKVVQGVSRILAFHFFKKGRGFAKIKKWKKRIVKNTLICFEIAILWQLLTF
jgi:hypothetical protein